MLDLASVLSPIVVFFLVDILNACLQIGWSYLMVILISPYKILCNLVRAA